MSTDSEDVQAHPDTNSTAFATRAAQHYHVHAGAVWGLAPPVVFSSTYMVADAAQADRLAHKNPSTTTDEDGYFYSRWGNPTNEVAADVVSLLEGATGTRTFASGMNAITTLMMTLLVSGDHVVAPRAIYAGTYEWLAVFGPRMNISVTWVDATDVAAYRAAVQPNTRLLYAESPSNPTMRLTDLEALGALSLSLEGQTACVVDSTFATPYHCNPLSFAGVDAVVHSATKYMGGHSDLTAGTVSANDPQLLQNLGKASRLFGGPLAAMDSFLLQRGLKTLDVRMERHARNALHVATFLESHPAVLACHYPGLQSHPDHALAKCQFRQGSGFGGMLSFDVGSVEAGKKVVEAVQLANLAVSLGAVETLIEHPASMTHACIPREQRLAAGITDGLIRLSVGLEAPVDLLADLDQALELACSDEVLEKHGHYDVDSEVDDDSDSDVDEKQAMWDEQREAVDDEQRARREDVEEAAVEAKQRQWDEQRAHVAHEQQERRRQNQEILQGETHLAWERAQLAAEEQQRQQQRSDGCQDDLEAKARAWEEAREMEKEAEQQRAAESAEEAAAASAQPSNRRQSMSGALPKRDTQLGVGILPGESAALLSRRRSSMQTTTVAPIAGAMSMADAMAPLTAPSRRRLSLGMPVPPPPPAATQHSPIKGEIQAAIPFQNS